MTGKDTRQNKQVLLLMLCAVTCIFCDNSNVRICIKDLPQKKDYKANGLILQTVTVDCPVRCAKLCASIGGCEAVSYHTVETKCELNFNITDTPVTAPGWQLFDDVEFAKPLLGPCNKQITSGRQCNVLSHSGQTIDKTSHCLNAIEVNGQISNTIAQRTVGTTLSVSCSSGLTENITCRTNGVWSAGCLTLWPSGVYAFLQPETGCPDGFSSGNIKFQMPFGSNSGKSSPYHVKGSVGSTSITWYFCTKTTSTSGSNWPAGNYCILRHNTCPSGFVSGHLHIYPSSAIVIQNIVPPFGTTTSPTPYVCCREDGSTSTPIILPTERPFILFKYKSDCQTVKNMVSQAEHTYFDDQVVDTSRAYRHYLSSTLATYSPTGIKFYFCYYS